MFRLLFILMIGCPLIVDAKQSAHWQSSDYLIDSFVEIALHNEFSSQESVVRKWNAPIKYYFIHRMADAALHEQLSVLHLTHLAKITGVTFSRVEILKAANLLIIFSTEDRLQNELLQDFGITSAEQRNLIFRQSICLGHFSAAGGDITRAIIIIPVDRARAHAKLISCIVEELTQVMGLPNDSEKVFPSVFNDRSFNELLTGLDYLLLKMLYDDRIKAGMNKKEVLPVLKKIAHEFERMNLFDTAEKDVMSGGLYPLLY